MIFVLLDQYSMIVLVMAIVGSTMFGLQVYVRVYGVDAG